MVLIISQYILYLITIKSVQLRVLSFHYFVCVYSLVTFKFPTLYFLMFSIEIPFNLISQQSIDFFNGFSLNPINP
jgi:hypothetical protein